MFCNQCEESIGSGCSQAGACGKTAVVAKMQDVLLDVLRGVSYFAQKVESKEADALVIDGLFQTITNVNFSEAHFREEIQKAISLRDTLRDAYESDGGVLSALEIRDFMIWKPENDASIFSRADEVSLMSIANEDIRSLKAILLYGLKGLSAYLHHARVLGENDSDIVNFVHDMMILHTREDADATMFLEAILKCGKFGVDTMALLDKANTCAYGNPEITKVALGVDSNPGILISGHDLKDMEMLLKQTDGTGVDVYTHGEMLPAHYYPEFKKYSHLKGNYGSSWFHQANEFETFNGPILMTTNCIVSPKDSYKDRLFTTSVVGYEGIKHIKASDNGMKDFSELIELAKKCAPPLELESGEIIGGFAHAQTLALSEKILDAVKSGALKKFVVMAGCDGRKKEREYYTDFAKALPSDTVILTAGCAKYRYIKEDLGDINGIPRVIDAGQCNDCYSLAVVALKLKEVLGLDDINKLPIVYNIAWYEQKAVLVLLALLHLGVKNIMLGPRLPAFVSENVLNQLVDTFGLIANSSVDEDMKSLVG
jgi:hydroxylamine reductase